MEFYGPSYGARPREYLQSVDLSLTLLLMLRDTGEITVTQAASLLEVSPSTVHRAMAMLVYRGFASRNESRSYLPGPALHASSLTPGLGMELVTTAEPYMHAIAAATGETCHIQAISGAKSHFLHTVEGTHPVRVGSRRGQIMPAEKNSGGLAMLAEMSARELRVNYPTLPDEEFNELRRVLARTRQRGYAINNGRFEHDVSAVGTCLRNEFGDTLGALVVAIPTGRFRTAHRHCAESLMQHARDLNQKLSKFHASPIR